MTAALRACEFTAFLLDGAKDFLRNHKRKIKFGDTKIIKIGERATLMA